MSDPNVPVRPNICRMVHYVAYGTPGGEYAPACRAAVITEVHGREPGMSDRQPVSVAVLNPTGLFFKEHLPRDSGEQIQYDEEPPAGSPVRSNHRGGTWHWPGECLRQA